MFGESKVKYLGFGSPLMDMIADVSEEFIKKYLFSNQNKY
jgi:hypothetical protein